MRFLFWQIRFARKPEIPEMEVDDYGYIWRVSDHKCFKRGQQGLYRAADGKFIPIYLLQQIRQGLVPDYLFDSQGAHFPYHLLNVLQIPLLGQEKLLKRLDQSEKATSGRS